MSRDKIKELLLETKTITEFMGNTVDYIIETNEYGVKGEPLTCYNYSTSWDHLMPVIEKIESLDLSDWYDKGNFANVNVSIESGHCYIFVELNYDPINNRTFKVEFIEDSCRYVLTTGKGYDTRNCIDLTCDTIFYHEVIGNIHENKELKK